MVKKKCEMWSKKVQISQKRTKKTVKKNGLKHSKRLKRSKTVQTVKNGKKKTHVKIGL